MDSQLIKDIMAIERSKPYIEYYNYHKDNIFGITKTSRLEHMHSSFLAWLLDSNSNHGLDSFPICQFIKTCYLVKSRPENEKARFNIGFECLNKGFVVATDRIDREYGFITGKGKRCSIDILINVHLFNNRIQPIVIENKVNANEHKNQTVDYFNWGEKEFSGKDFNEPIYVFLTPEYNKKLPVQEEYLSIKYQDLVDNVIEPCMWNASDSTTCNNIKMYLQCLSYQADNEKGENAMAISTEEKRILSDFIQNNKNMLCSIIDNLSELDGIDINDEAKKIITDSVRDYGKYSFNGQIYGKNRLVLAVVKQYVKDKKPANYKELLKVFPDDIQGNKKMGVIRKEEVISDKNKGIGGQKRFFVDDPIVLESGERVLVCTQWGLKNINTFIEAASGLGYEVNRQ